MAPNDVIANSMRAEVLGGCHIKELSGRLGAWEAGPRTAAEFKEAASYFDRSAALSTAPTMKAQKVHLAGLCRSRAEARCS